MENLNVLSDINADSLDWNIRDDLKGLSLAQINELQPKLGFAVCMLNTTGSLNIGVALRSAVLFGASKFYIVGRRRYDKRSTVGAHNYIDVERIEANDGFQYDVNTIFKNIKEDGFNPVFVEMGGADVVTIKSSCPENPCFILGEEKSGIPDEFYIDPNIPTYAIETVGVLRSLNVSVAASIIMYEYTKKDSMTKLPTVTLFKGFGG
jgi:tRNA G18 (ribose-2'-O)-methylase SpoU